MLVEREQCEQKKSMHKPMQSEWTGGQKTPAKNWIVFWEEHTGINLFSGLG